MSQKTDLFQLRWKYILGEVVYTPMKKFMVIAWVALATVCFTHRSCAQCTLTPLYLFTTGSGEITPFSNGQMLEVGQNYEMEAIPDAGFAFSSWQPVDAFVYTVTYLDANGNPLPPVTSVAPSPMPNYTFQPVLDFTMQSPIEITAEGANPSITESFGWQANFVPVPEPSDAALVACGVIMVLLFRRKETLESAIKFETFKDPSP